MGSKVFNHAMDNMLISLVRKHPVLYQPCEINYKNTNLRRHVWTDIAKNIGKSVGECKIRWRTIRDSYRKNKRKSRTDDESLSRSKYDTETLRFLDDVPPKTKSGLKRNYSDTNSMSHLEDPDENSLDHNEESEDLGGTEEGSGFRVTLVRGHAEEFEMDVPRPPPPSNVLCVDAKAFEEMKSELEGRFEMLQSRLARDMGAGQHPEHPVETFFRSMASTVMTLSPHLIAEAKVRVCKIISELEVRNLTERS